MPEVVAGKILAVRGELDREAHVGTAMQAVQEALDGRARDQLQVIELRQNPGIDHVAQPHLGRLRFRPWLDVPAASDPGRASDRDRALRWECSDGIRLIG